MARIDRIGELVRPLRIRCRGCGHEAAWTPKEARMRLGGWCTTLEARRRLKCSRCGEGPGWMIVFSA